jgi:cytidine deaminase
MKKQVIESTQYICLFEELEVSYQHLISEAKKQVYKAYAPYSNFFVGSAVLLENGEVYVGSNQENAAYPSGLCAERVSLFYANAQRPDVAPKALAIAAYSKGEFLATPISPCGSCLQVLLEAEMRFNSEITILLYGTNHCLLIKNIKQFLPFRFDKISLV